MSGAELLLLPAAAVDVGGAAGGTNRPAAESACSCVSLTRCSHAVKVPGLPTVADSARMGHLAVWDGKAGAE